MDPLVQSNGLVRPCCLPENLEISRKGDGEHQGLRGDLVVRVCRVCKARHIELSVPQGHLFSKPSPLR